MKKLVRKLGMKDISSRKDTCVQDRTLFHLVQVKKMHLAT